MRTSKATILMLLVIGTSFHNRVFSILEEKSKRVTHGKPINRNLRKRCLGQY
jgi:hypothetical protein